MRSELIEMYGATEVAAPRGWLHRLTDAVQSTARAYLDWRLRRATVRILTSMDDRMLRDIGMTRSEIHSVVYGDAEGRTPSYDRTWE
jgi:uncharacterized protein YjiS (DUF1127 family)